VKRQLCQTVTRTTKGVHKDLIVSMLTNRIHTHSYSTKQGHQLPDNPIGLKCPHKKQCPLPVPTDCLSNSACPCSYKQEPSHDSENLKTYILQPAPKLGKPCRQPRAAARLLLLHA
jgi:hypothetical protein